MKCNLGKVCDGKSSTHTKVVREGIKYEAKGEEDKVPFLSFPAHGGNGIRKLPEIVL